MNDGKPFHNVLQKSYLESLNINQFFLHIHLIRCKKLMTFNGFFYVFINNIVVMSLYQAVCVYSF